MARVSYFLLVLVMQWDSISITRLYHVVDYVINIMHTILRLGSTVTKLILEALLKIDTHQNYPLYSKTVDKVTKIVNKSPFAIINHR